ncbi:MAG TPA: hypothetical protein VMZ53_33830 [Kofleriaceae bacterium]|nr:hypothetical protein [Kofleriaceae bacterium]
MYRDDHEAALCRIEALERENVALTRENARLLQVQPRPRDLNRPKPTSRQAKANDAKEVVVFALGLLVLIVCALATP